MPDYYHLPALILTALLLPAFGYLYLRFRDTRSFLWFLGFLFSIVAMVLLYTMNGYPGADSPWLVASGQISMQLSAAMFLGSLSPLRFRIGRIQVLFVVAYAAPLVLYSIFLYGVLGGVQPSGPAFLIFPALVGMSFGVGVFWGMTRGTVPTWLGVSFSSVLGTFAIWVCCLQGAAAGLTFVECVNLQLTVVLLVFVSRRFSPGVFLSTLGFFAWSLAPVHVLLEVRHYVPLDINLTRVIVMGKVVAAVGMIMLALEDELKSNRAAQERERSARRQLEAYANLMLTRRRVEDFDRQAAEVCDTVVTNSRFAQAALLLECGGRYQLAGYAGLEVAIARPLGQLASRIPVEGFLVPGSAPIAVAHSKTVRLDLAPWLIPGDDLARLRFTSVLAIPMIGRSGVDGALLLGAMRVDGEQGIHSANVPRLDDLLPIEMLVARLQATRSQTMLFEKLIDSERFAGLGQLSGNVTQQLNSPLTVILGYASLLQESPALEVHDRKAVEAIVNEARSIRSTLQSLSRVSHVRSDQPAAISVTELLADMEQLYRPEFLQRSIEFQVNVAPGMPRILCGAQQLRQALLHCLQYAIGAVDREGPSSAFKESKSIRLEAAREGSLVHISVTHSGPGFLDPERAFDPFVPARACGETAGMGLSLCATILRDQNGRASAVNLQPRGAAIILELQAA
ncbi:MAG: HAMP domain-containing sensor histidine kinase [Terracidiphilus sp.]